MWRFAEKHTESGVKMNEKKSEKSGHSRSRFRNEISAGDKGAAERNDADCRQTGHPIYCRRGRSIRN
ncbi:hypothetical protein [Bacillus sp. AM1(2019)]|uniref:hypothetical protein n=1 Tax=Bacillus sp. AM1(2019) TaxID=2665175 RepID=UPI003FA46AFF